jgi:hypothetical protein
LGKIEARIGASFHRVCSLTKGKVGIIIFQGGFKVFDTKRVNADRQVEVAVCPICSKRVRFISQPMIRCYTTGDLYEKERIVWRLESDMDRIGYEAEDIRGNDYKDFQPNSHSNEE